MFRNRTFKVLSNFILLVVLCTGQVTAAPNKSVNEVNTAIWQPPPFFTKWGSGGNASSQFNCPIGIAVDNATHVFVADTQNNRIQKFDRNGKFLTAWNTSNPSDVAIDSSGNVYVAEYYTGLIKKFDQYGNLLTGFMGGTLPRGIAIDNSSGNIYVADERLIIKYDGSGNWLNEWDTSDGYETDVAVDSMGDIYVVSYQSNTVRKYDSNGNLLSVWGPTNGGSGEGEFSGPISVAVDSLNNVYVADRGNQRIQVLDKNGNYLGKWGSDGDNAGQFVSIWGVFVNNLGDVYVSDCALNRIQEFSTQLNKPPLVLVHGYQGSNSDNPDGFSCDLGHIQDEDIKLWDSDSPNSSNPTLGNDLPEWLEQEGYQVWIAHLESSKNDGTPVLEYNAQCLKNQVNYVYSQNPQKITIVAHSMGGLVSRAAINYIKNPQSKISSLFTLGSPHAGLPSTLTMVYGSLSNQDAVFNMMEESMNGVDGFNGRIYNQQGIDYYFISGDASPVKSLGPILYSPLGRKHDGLVSSYSALGWKYPNNTFDPPNWVNASQPHQYYTDEVHISNWGNSYYTAPPGDLHSYSFECIKNLLKHLAPSELFCQDVMTASASAQNLTVQSVPDISAFTELINGPLNAGESISIPMEIDTNTSSLFYLTWSGETPAFTLTRPDTQVINPVYATAHPSEVTYENFVGGAGVPPYAAYNFNATQPGTWQLNIVANGATDYQAFAAFDSSRTLTAQTDKDIYQIADTAIITADLDSSGTGLTGATVTAKLTRPDDIVDVVSLIDQGNGTYSNTYPIPNAAGYLTIDVTASGNDNGTAFSRQENLLVAIAPNDLQLTGTYDDQPRDDNADGIYDFLDFSAQVNLAAPGEYAVSAELYAGDQLITQSGDFFELAAGAQTVTLSFDGHAIYEAGLDGPYTVKNLYFTPIDIGITAASVETAWTTSAYSHTQFDFIAPQVNSITRANANQTNAANVDFMVTFSESVANVDASDFSLITNGVSGASISSVNGSSNIYIVTVNTGVGSGTIRLDVPTGAVVKDLPGNSIANLPFTNGQTYTISKPVPKAPVLRSPRTSTITIDTTPTFWWTNVKYGQTYEIVFATDSSFTNIVHNNNNAVSPYTPPALADGKYYWRVRAYNVDNQPGALSSARVITIDTTGPSAPVLSSPVHNSSSKRSPTFKWLSVPSATTYQFQYDNNSNFSSPTYSVTTRSNFRKPPSMKIGTYYWHVRAKDASGNWGPWSVPFTVTITSP